MTWVRKTEPLVARKGDRVWFRLKGAIEEFPALVVRVFLAEDVVAFTLLPDDSLSTLTAYPEFGDQIHRCFSWRAS